MKPHVRPVLARLCEKAFSRKFHSVFLPEVLALYPRKFGRLTEVLLDLDCPPRRYWSCLKQRALDMTRIFKAGPQDGYEWVNLRNHDDREYLLTLGPHRIAHDPPELPAYRILEDGDERFAAADMPWMWGHGLVLRPHVREVLEPVLGPSVEFLPLQLEDGSVMWTTHALTVAAVLDCVRSELKRFPSSGRIMRIIRHEFTEDVALAGPAFHLSEMPRGSLYFTEDVVEEAIRSGFTGTRFEQVWGDGAA